MRILVVDGDTAIRARLAAFIDLELGCEVLTCETREEALELISQVDAILCDGRFPASRERVAGEALTVRPPFRPTNNWLIVDSATAGQGKHFVFFARNRDTVELALRLDVPAFLKVLGTSQALNATP